MAITYKTFEQRFLNKYTNNEISILTPNQYINITKPLDIKCNICLHIWETPQARNIIKPNCKGCPKCSFEKRKKKNTLTKNNL